MTRRRESTRAESPAFGANGLVLGYGGDNSTHAPRSFPAKRRSKSARVVASTYTTSPARGPFVPGAHAHDTALIQRSCGDNRRMLSGPRCQATPNGHGSSVTV